MTQRAWRLLAILVLLLAGTWQLRPLLVWHLAVEPELGDGPERALVHARREASFPGAPEDWALLESGRVTLRAPLADPGAACAVCGGGCTLPLERGKLTVFAGPPPPAYQDALDTLAPDVGDLRVFRSRARNWDSLHALIERVRAPSSAVESFRYQAAGSRGVVVRFDNADIERFVVYSYAESGIAGPVVALSRSGGDVLRRVLGSLRVRASAAPESRCSS